MRRVLACLKAGPLPIPKAQRDEPHIREDALRVAVEALEEAREALHHHYVEWDGEPEDAAPLQLARAECDKALAVLQAEQGAK